VGTVKDLFFSGDSWVVRYVVVDTGRWLPGRQVLLSPHGLEQVYWPNRTMSVRQTRRQIEESPPVSEHEPVSRRREIELADYFEWPRYRNETAVDDPCAEAERAATGAAQLEADVTQETPDPNLRSAKEVIGYRVEASDGEIGRIQDFVLEDDAWIIRYLVVDTQRWLPWGSVLVSPTWTKGITWEGKLVLLDLAQDEVKGSPEFEPWAPVNRVYEERLYDYYGRPAYWR
jgi:hypothetical protein